MSEESENLGAIANVVSGIYSVVDDDKKKKISDNIGDTLIILSSTVRNVFLPLAAINYGVDKAKTYFQTKFEGDLEKETSEIPPEALIEPKASIAAPLIQGLAFAVDEPDLKDMYLKLLASAMDGRTSNNVHPAFIEVLKQSSAQDILLVNHLADSIYPFVRVVDLYVSAGGAKFKALGNFGPYITECGMNANTYMVSIENLVRLGVLKIDGATNEGYDEIKKFAVEALKPSIHLEGKEIYSTVNKTLRLTSFGMSFIIHTARPGLKNMPLHMFS